MIFYKSFRSLNQIEPSYDPVANNFLFARRSIHVVGKSCPSTSSRGFLGILVLVSSLLHLVSGSKYFLRSKLPPVVKTDP